jgi:uncharacterized membrane protein
MKQHSVLIAQIAGIAVLVLAIFGIEVDDKTRADIITGLSAIGLIITAVVDRIQKSIEEDKNEDDDDYL